MFYGPFLFWTRHLFHQLFNSLLYTSFFFLFSSSHSFFLFFSSSHSLGFFFFFFEKKNVGEKVIRSWMRVGRKGHLCKNAISPLFSQQFSSRFGKMRLMGPGEKIFSRIFLPQCFPSFAKQWKILFFTLFSSLSFPSSLKSPQPNTVLVFSTGKTVG